MVGFSSGRFSEFFSRQINRRQLSYMNRGKAISKQTSDKQPVTSLLKYARLVRTCFLAVIVENYPQIFSHKIISTHFNMICIVFDKLKGGKYVIVHCIERDCERRIRARN